MQVPPNSTIILYSGMPLDNTYSDTLYFQNLSIQTTFFTINNSFEKRRFTANTYQRVNAHVFEAQCVADEIYDCNYMAFQNTRFGGKWFYAFITSVEYINNGNTRVTFEIDVIQTYLFDCELEQCFVEREHPWTDNIGDNLQPEPIGLSETVYEKVNVVSGDNNVDLHALDICVMYVDVEGQGSVGSMISRTYSGANIRAFTTTTTGVQACTDFINDYIQKPDSIICVYMTPHFLTLGTDAGSETHTNWGANVTYTYPANSIVDFWTKLQGYTVKNKKLFTYPYTYMLLFNGSGESLPLRYEFFNGNPTFKIYGGSTPPVQISMNPVNYKGNGLSTPLMTESLTNADYPLCSWNYDTFRAWLAQNTVPMILRGVRGFINSATSKTKKGAAISAVNEGLSIASDFYTASIQADTIRGNIYNGNPVFASGYEGFYVCRATMTREQIQVVDNFFNKYGYAQNKIKVPNRASRPHWCYCKTSGCSVIGNCPSDDIKLICSIYDRGITWWKNAGEVGNYSYDNSPTPTP